MTLQPYYDTAPLVGARKASAKAVLFAEGNKILLLRKKGGGWDLPGGRLESGEDWIDGLSREIHEETGFRIAQAEWVTGWLDTARKNGPVVRGIFLSHLDCKPRKSIIRVSKEHLSGQFCPLARIGKIPLRQEYVHAVHWAAQAARYL